MSRRLRTVRATLFSTGVAAALLFGAASLRAEVRPAAACSDPFAEGSCTTTMGCTKHCRGVVGAGSGECSEGCCYCIWF